MGNVTISINKGHTDASVVPFRINIFYNIINVSSFNSEAWCQ